MARSGAGDAENAATAGPLPVTPEDEARREPILCFVGPPGVGKTSLGQSIARAMGRKFLRISLGGVHDEAEIRGHRRTYVGALPGRLIQALRRAETMDPVFMLDEVDKLGASFHGNPAAALLEVLDPAQNNAFVDTYLGVPFDLSKVLFICTANTTETIAAPLLDRMELVTLSGYTEAEKLHIARRYLLPKQIQAHGLRDGELEVDDGALRRIIADYTREAGVRQLERELAAVARKTARRIGEGEPGPIRVTAESLTSLLGRPRFFNEVAERVDRPGVATGLAWTPVGGEILFVEAALVPGQGPPVLTGMLGDVMRESAQAAVTFVRSNAQALGVDPKVFQENSVHIHVPAGAIPKDGPSAGVAMLSAVASVARGSAGEERHRDDRGDHPAGEGAAHRRAEGEGARRLPGADRAGDHSATERGRSGGRPGGGEGQGPVHPRRLGGRRAAGGVLNAAAPGAGVDGDAGSPLAADTLAPYLPASGFGFFAVVVAGSPAWDVSGAAATNSNAASNTQNQARAFLIVPPSVRAWWGLPTRRVSLEHGSVVSQPTGR